MTSLKFELNFKTDELRELDLPVEIRKPNMVLVKRALASETVEVEPGTYFVGIKMPAGQEAWSEVQVVEGPNNKVVLSPAQADESPSDSHEESHELQHYFTPRYVAPPEEELTRTGLLTLGAAGAAAGAGLGYSFAERESVTAVAAMIGAALLPALLSHVLQPGYKSLRRRLHEARLRKFTGNVLLGDYKTDDEKVLNPERIRDGGDLTEITIKGEDRGQIIQLLQTGDPAINVVLPAWHENACRVVVKRLPDGRYSLEVHLQNTEAELLLRYWEQGLWQQAASVSESAAVSAQQLLRDKLKHPIAAAVGAYALLRLGALERLHDWSDNLMHWFEWLPDGAAIRGEHLARMGEHKRALHAFCLLQERGLPYFSDGLSYAVDRLRLYRSLGEKHFDAKALERGAATLALLEPFCPVTDFSKPLTTFTGLDPSKPDANPLGGNLRPYGGNLKSYGGLDLVKLIQHRDASK